MNVSAEHIVGGLLLGFVVIVIIVGIRMWVTRNVRTDT